MPLPPRRRKAHDERESERCKLFSIDIDAAMVLSLLVSLIWRAAIPLMCTLSRLVEGHSVLVFCFRLPAVEHGYKMPVEAIVRET